MAHRLLVFIFASFCMTACATQSADKEVTMSSCPSFYGRFESISDQDKDVIVDIARKRVVKKMPGAEVAKVKVFSATEVGVTYEKDSTDDSGNFDLQKVDGRWQ